MNQARRRKPSAAELAAWKALSDLLEAEYARRRALQALV